LSMRKLLITGFGPFPRVPRNPSASLARDVAADPRWRRLGVAVEALVLDTRYSAIDTHLVPKIREFRPDAILMLGVALRRRHVGIETRAINRVSRLLHDAEGRIAAQPAFRRGAPRMLHSHAPLVAIMQAMRRRGVDARLSRDAGRYLCNAAYFAALAEIVQMPRAGTVFIHLPVPRKINRAKRKISHNCPEGAVGKHEVPKRESTAMETLHRSAIEAGVILLKDAHLHLIQTGKHNRFSAPAKSDR